jgi:23S rRNA (adenine2503-C2)-methyltransferase
VASWADATDVPAPLRAALDEVFPLKRLTLRTQQVSTDGTQKFLWALDDGEAIESVLIPEGKRRTLCISSQAGCALGCVFCATGRMGFRRNLSASEIAGQVRELVLRDPALKPTNVVFMGMGEPMANYRATRDAITRLLDPAGMDLGARHVTVSTVGIVPGIRHLGGDHPQVGLAVSLHAADDELRNRLVPVNKLWPLAELEEAVGEWRALTNRRPSIEWTMMRGANDDDHQAVLLAPIARRLHAHVNLIPMNPTSGSEYKPSTPKRIESFVRVLRRGGVPVTVRDTRGREIEAACGQLRWEMAQMAAAP